MEEIEEEGYQRNDYYMKILNKYPKIVQWIQIYLIFSLFFIFYSCIVYKYHDCQSASSAIFIFIITGFYLFLLKNEYHPQQRLKLALFVCIITIIIMLNIILDENKKTICNVTVCHELDIFQENINVTIASLKKNKNICNELGSKNKNTEDSFEDNYLGLLNFIWTVLCRFYESLSVENSCQNEVNLDNVFLNYEFKIILIIYFISLLLFLFLSFEIVLKIWMKLIEVQPESQNIPLLEYYQKSSINQKDQNDTAIYIGNQMFNQPKYNDLNLSSNNELPNFNNNNNNNINNSKYDLYNPLDNITPDQSRVRKHDEQLSNQIKQQYNYEQN